MSHERSLLTADQEAIETGVGELCALPCECSPKLSLRTAPPAQKTWSGLSATSQQLRFRWKLLTGS